MNIPKIQEVSFSNPQAPVQAQTQPVQTQPIQMEDIATPPPPTNVQKPEYDIEDFINSAPQPPPQVATPAPQPAGPVYHSSGLNVVDNSQTSEASTTSTADYWKYFLFLAPVIAGFLK